VTLRGSVVPSAGWGGAAPAAEAWAFGVTAVFLSVNSPAEEMCDDSHGLSDGHHGPQAGDATVLCAAACSGTRPVAARVGQ
jgi:hypothetical protein